MRLGPYEITIARVGVEKRIPANLSSVESRGGWWPLIREPYSGAWQENAEESVETILEHSAVFACVTLIAADIAKMRLRLVAQDSDMIWTEVERPAFSPVLRKPNHYQNRIQFYFWWMISKLLHGNTYALKQRDQRQIVHGLYILDPTRVRPLVAPDGQVYYELKTDNLSLLKENGPIFVPAREIIHDVGCPLFHPLVGVSPIYACGVSALQGIRIQNNQSQFFGNGSMPGGVLTAPGPISQETAVRVKTHWDTEFTGDNMGKVAVLGDGLHFEGMVMKAIDAQLIEQLNWTGQDICTAFRVPGYKVGIGPHPNYNNVEALDRQYYSQCLQFHIESLELVMDEGLGLHPDKIDGQRLGVEFDLDDLMRMDSATMMTTLKEGVIGGLVAPNEARLKLNYRPVKGGETPYLQQQNFSLEALSERDEEGPPAAPAQNQADEPDETDKFLAAFHVKALEENLYHAA